MRPSQKRDILLDRARSVLQVHEANGTIPTLHTSRILTPQRSRTSAYDFKAEMGEPVCYLYISAARDPRSLLGGPDAIMFQSHALTVKFCLEWREDDDFDASSQADYETAIYSDDPAAPGLMYSLENDRILEDIGYGRALIDRMTLSPVSDSVMYLAGQGQGVPAHTFQGVATISADVTQPA